MRRTTGAFTVAIAIVGLAVAAPPSAIAQDDAIELALVTQNFAIVPDGVVRLEYELDGHDSRRDTSHDAATTAQRDVEHRTDRPRMPTRRAGHCSGTGDVDDASDHTPATADPARRARDGVRTDHVAVRGVRGARRRPPFGDRQRRVRPRRRARRRTERDTRAAAPLSLDVQTATSRRGEERTGVAAGRAVPDQRRDPSGQAHTRRARDVHRAAGDP